MQSLDQGRQQSCWAIQNWVLQILNRSERNPVGLCQGQGQGLVLTDSKTQRQQEPGAQVAMASHTHTSPLHLLTRSEPSSHGVVSPQAADGPELSPQLTSSYPGTQEQDRRCKCFLVGTALSTRTQSWTTRVQADPGGFNTSHAASQ